MRLTLLASAIASLATPVIAADFPNGTPAVRGPESVADWFNAGKAHLFKQDLAQAAAVTPRNRLPVKNVILFVGDGMGISTVTAARILAGEKAGLAGPERGSLHFETFPDLALSKVYQWDQQTPDSAPTATAMHTGYKTRESMLGVNHTINRKECRASETAAKSVKSIAEYVAERGKSVGFVSTARITHATPASGYAHISARDWETNREVASACASVPAADRVADIATQALNPANAALKAQLKVLLGGGRRGFLPNTVTDPEYATLTGRRTDGKNLTAEWLSTRANAKYVWGQSGGSVSVPEANDFSKVTAANTDYLLGLFDPSHAQFESDRARDPAKEPSLTEMTVKAIEILKKNNRGFFLHVESGRIDHAHHAGNARRALEDTIEFARAVKAADDATSDGDTLIIVTADHSHVFTIAGYPHRGNPILGLSRGIPDNDGEAITPETDVLGLPYTTLGYQNGPGYTGLTAGSPTATQTAGLKTFTTTSTGQANDGYFLGAGTNSGAVRPDLTNVDTTALNFLQESAVPISAETHSAEEVAIYAKGPFSQYVRGVMEQNWIFHVMAKAFGLRGF
jgi:alkaline phosphatase